MRPQVSDEIIARLSAICLALPQTTEEAAWVGVRWRVRRHSFAHVLVIDQGWPPAYAEAARTCGPATVMTFRSSIAALDPQHYAAAPFFRPKWFSDIVGLFLNDRTDWEDVATLVAASYRLLAPKGLAAGAAMAGAGRGTVPGG